MSHGLRCACGYRETRWIVGEHQRVKTWLEHEIREAGGLVRRSRSNRNQFDHAVQRGGLARVLPGVACLPEIAGDLLTRARAVNLYEPDAVVCGAAAAALTWWPELQRPEMEIKVASAQRRTVGRGYSWTRSMIATEMILEWGGIRMATPELSVLQMIPRFEGRVIDEALRRRATSLARMWQALELTPAKQGNVLCAKLFHDSRDGPWSEPERLAHRALRESGINGWKANLRVTHHSGFAYLDIGFEDCRLGLEIDGTTFHSSPWDLERDRLRDVALALEGWQLVRYPASCVNEPGWSDTVAKLLAIRRGWRRRAA